MMEVGSKISFSKLNNQNYQPWKFKMKMLLIREGTWKTIEENKPENEIKALVHEFGLEDAAPVTIPMETEYPKLSEDTNLLPNNDKYRKAVGALLYLSTTTRPDISNAVNYLTRRVSNPRQADWNAAKRVIKYLKGTCKFRLKLGTYGNLVLRGYVDSDWAGDSLDRKSISGFIFLLGNNTISWSSKKQSSVALSSTEAEYLSASSAAQEIVWLQRLIQDFGIVREGPTVLFEDNQGCIKLAMNENINSRTKHIEVRKHYLKDLISKNVIDFVYCPSSDMLADGFTKPLPRTAFEKFRRAIGISFI